LTPNNFLWSFGDGNTDATNLNATNIYANSGQFTANFRVTENGCSNSTSHIVTVFPYPVINLGPDQTFCYGTRLDLNAGNQGATYLWSDNSNNQHLTVTSAGTYSVTVTNGQSCNASDDITVVYYPRSPITVSPSDSTLCRGDSLLVTVTGSPDIRWYPSRWLSDSTGNSVIIKPYSSTLYLVLGRNSYNCFDTAYVRIIANELPVVNLGSDVVLCNYPSYTLRGENSDYTYLWPDGSTNSTLIVTVPGTYWIQANNSGCIRSDTINIYPCTNIYVPNAFTPDNNLLNDFFFGVPSDTFKLAYFSLYIFDRWGGTVFQTDNIYKKWDGTFNGEDCPQGTYGWKMLYAVKGMEGNDNQFEKQGSVTLIR
jgi:gliding motility-associated-like protein